MPTIWYARDGKRPHTQHGPGVQISHNEANELFANEVLKFCGQEAPSINPNMPSDYPKNVVIELGREESVSKIFPEPGFYLVGGLRPEMVDNRLEEIRGDA